MLKGNFLLLYEAIDIIFCSEIFVINFINSFQNVLFLFYVVCMNIDFFNMKL